jgi:hypothetical protein
MHICHPNSNRLFTSGESSICFITKRVIAIWMEVVKLIGLSKGVQGVRKGDYRPRGIGQVSIAGKRMVSEPTVTAPCDNISSWWERKMVGVRLDTSYPIAAERSSQGSHFD